MPLAPELFNEIRTSLAERFSGRICSSFDSGSSWFSLTFRPSGENLFFSWSDSFQGICTASREQVSFLSASDRSNPLIRDVLNKYFQNFRLEKVSRSKGDRILILDFRKMVGAGIGVGSTIVAEFSGRAPNVIFLRDDGTVIESARSVSSGGYDSLRYRPGEPYLQPDPFIGRELSDSCDPSIFFSLDSLSGYGKKAGEAINNSWHHYPLSSWKSFFMTSQYVREPGERSSAIIQSLNGVLSVFPIQTINGERAGEDLLRTLGKFVVEPLFHDFFKHKKRRYISQIKKSISRLRSLKKGYRNRMEQSLKAEEYKLAGNLLLTWKKRVPKGASSVSLPLWNDNGGDTVIPVDPSKTVSANAQDYFRKFRKYSVDPEKIEKELDEVISRENDLAALMSRIQNAPDPGELSVLARELEEATVRTKNRKSHGPVKVYDLPGNQILAGSSAKGNRKVTFVLADGDDLWFHARGVPGGHVILKKTIAGGFDDVIVIQIAASVAAWLTRSREAEKVAVDYTFRKYVRPIPGTTAEVTYSRSRTITVSPVLWKEHLSETP
ncbi:MAG TPA: NFACT family protein [Synergistales bacterium]|nr:NFACT family protein [Synergistales bacterium]HRV71922.1 NFACT family protein [Thermovirgaceae bacterium]